MLAGLTSLFWIWIKRREIRSSKTVYGHSLGGNNVPYLQTLSYISVSDSIVCFALLCEKLSVRGDLTPGEDYLWTD